MFPYALETTVSASSNLTIHKADICHIGSFAWDGSKALPRVFSGDMPPQRGHQIFQDAKITHGLPTLQNPVFLSHIFPLTWE